MEFDYSKIWNPKITIKARGRGAGKTYEGSRWLVDKALNNPDAKIATISRGSTKEYLIEHIIDAGNDLGLNPKYNPYRRCIDFNNGARITLYEAEKPDTFRGPSHDFLMGDDVEKWSETAYFYATAGVRPDGVRRSEMWMNFTGTESHRIMDLLQNGFDGTTG